MRRQTVRAKQRMVDALVLHTPESDARDHVPDTDVLGQGWGCWRGVRHGSDDAKIKAVTQALRIVTQGMQELPNNSAGFPDRGLCTETSAFPLLMYTVLLATSHVDHEKLRFLDVVCWCVCYAYLLGLACVAC